jgi:D-glycero-D-manno-heptose 1,7-bisphosphate phosphatase
MLRPAVFLDRDGTLNVDRSYLTRPEQLQLLPGVGPALQQLRAAGFALVVVTNQSAIGRGLMIETDLQDVHAEMNRQLAELGVFLDGIYHCPAAPLSSDPLVSDHPDRKPAPGMLLRAAGDLRLDLARSWMIGDALRDVLAGQNAGCRGCVLVRTGQVVDEAHFSLARPFVITDDLAAAARHIVEQRPRSPSASG